MVKDYSPEISQVFSNFNGVPWYMGGAYTLMPFAGVPVDNDLKAILSKDAVRPLEWKPGLRQLLQPLGKWSIMSTTSGCR